MALAFEDVDDDTQHSPLHGIEIGNKAVMTYC